MDKTTLLSGVLGMKDEETKATRKWTTITVPTLGLAVACLMGPVAFLLKVTVRDLVRQELGGYESMAAAEAKWKAHHDFEAEVFKRWENDLAVLREQPSLSYTNQTKLLLEIGARLTSLETKLKFIAQDGLHSGKPAGTEGGP